MSSDDHPEVVTFGEAMIRLSPALGEPLEYARELAVHVGGSEANVAVAVARMGHRPAWFSRLPSSPLGRRIAADLVRNGVDVSNIVWAPEGRVGTYYYEPGVVPRPGRVTYDRAGSTVCDLTVDDVPWSLLLGARIVHLTGITPALSPRLAQLTLEAANRVRRGNGLLSVDVNYRARLWPQDAARPILTELCRSADIMIIAEVDARRVFKVDGSPDSIAASLQETLAAKTIIVTSGNQGSAWRIGAQAGATRAIPAEQVDRLGSGDAFAAGVIVGALENDMELGLRLGTAMASLKLGYRGDQFLGTRTEVNELLAEAGAAVDR